ncbi:protogenin-like [Euwallacea similis]|uniref:protogenin-like n=1 Tax=Euwallacea similis TaxID=1736056 RepID=UPI00344E443E
MAVRTLQLCIVFAVGLFVGPVAAITGSNRAVRADSPPSFSTLPNPLTKNNVSLRFLEEPSDMVVARGQDVTLQCAAKSTTGNLSIFWLYEGQPIPQGDPRWEIQGSQLRLLKVTGSKKSNIKSNTGEYSCLATNQVGAILSTAAKVKIGSMDKEVTISVRNWTTYESQPLLLQCNVHSTPSADIQWEINHLPLPKDKRYVPLPNGTLLIRDTKFNDSGDYRCLARNSVLKKTKYSKDLNIVISPLPLDGNISPALISFNSRPNRTALLGDTVEFFCLAAGWPLPTVQWINNKNVTLNSSSTLIVRNAHSKDSGNYTCVASNTMGRKFQTFYLDVLQKPYFNTTPESKVSPSAQTVRIECQARGTPNPKITWLKNGKPLTPDVRIKKTWNGLVFSHTVSTDTGIYQCIATNAAGRVWTAAQIEINNSQSPRPPQQVTCRPYDDDKICVTWKPPANVSLVTAYNIHSSYTVDGSEITGPEYLETNNTFRLAEDLRHSTNYTFYIRLFTNHASDHSERVTCQTGLKGFRNLDVEPVNSTAVTLKWDILSSDTLCNGTKDHYQVQWFRDGDDSHMSSVTTLDISFMISGLLPATDYQFRVIAQNNPRDELWIMYSLPDYQESENETSVSGELRAPKYLHEDSTTTTSTRVSWDRVANAKFYTVCYLPAKDDDMECTEDDFIKTYLPKYSIVKLKPNTQYFIRVRAYDSNNVPGALSQPLRIKTPLDVPSPVMDLRYTALNSSTVCVYWRQPENKNAELANYLLSYTTDKYWSLENLIELNVSVDSRKGQSCRQNDAGLISTYLTNLTTEHTYLVMVRAANAVGIGQPCAPIIVKTYELNDNPSGIVNNDAANNQKLGIILGVLLAAVCIICCITLILLRRRCLKRRAATRAHHLPPSGDYHPAVAHYTSQMGTVQVRMEQPSAVDEHEIEQLVPEEHVSHIPPAAPERFDTKGASDLPNGCVNGVRKYSHMNGHGVNGAVHITENPQYYAFECNGNLAKNKSEPLLSHYEEDSNSNVKSAKFYGFHRLINDPNDKYKERSKSKSDELNCTQLTFLDDSINSQRRLSPLLEPNG